MIIRKAAAADIPRLIELLGVLFSVELDFVADVSKQRAGLELMLDDENKRCVLVAEDNARVIGMCTAQMLVSTAEGGAAALIEDVVVDERYRQLGIGKKLVAAIEDWAVTRGAKRLQLLADQTNTPALKFYDRIGWNNTRMICLQKKL